MKIWSYERPIPLSERVPVLENTSLEETVESVLDLVHRATGARERV